MNIYKFQSQSIFLNASITLLVGILLFNVPILVVSVFVQAVGLIIGGSGLVLLLIHFINKKRGKALHPIYLSQAFLNIALGIMMLAMPKVMIDFVFLIIGLWLLFLGGYELVYTWRLFKQYGLNKYMLIHSVLLLIIALFLIFNPYIVISGFLNIIGILLIVLSLFMFFIAYNNRKINFDK